MYCHILHCHFFSYTYCSTFFLPHYLSPHHIFLPPLPCLHYPSASFILLCQRADLLGWAESLSAELFELQQPVSLWGKVEQARCGKMEQGRAVFTYWWMYRSVSAGILKGCQGFAQCICARQNTVERQQQFFFYFSNLGVQAVFPIYPCAPVWVYCSVNQTNNKSRWGLDE